MSVTALISTFDSSYIFSPNKHIIFWLPLLLIDLPLHTGCQAVPQTVELITLHSAPILYHSAFFSSVPDIFSYPAADNLVQKGIPIPLLSSGPGIKCNSAVMEAFIPQSPLPSQLKYKHWALVDLPLAVSEDVHGSRLPAQTCPSNKFGGGFIWAKRGIYLERM